MSIEEGAPWGMTKCDGAYPSLTEADLIRVAYWPSTDTKPRQLWNLHAAPWKTWPMPRKSHCEAGWDKVLLLPASAGGVEGFGLEEK